MRNVISAVAGIALIATSAVAAGPANATVHPVLAKKYSSCTKLQQVYPGGIAKSKNSKNYKTVGGKKILAASKYRPKVSASLYAASRGLDRDKDGIACER